MFGHVKGSFTSAIKDKPGRFEVADNGTMFLDDIDTLPIGLQAKLLRVLEDQEFERVGSTKTIKVDVRIIASSNQDLKTLIAEGQFRSDLFYRLNVMPIWLPPLRKRAGDLVVLADYFLKKYSAQNSKEIFGFTDQALRILEGYHWPGNVRELQHTIERAVILERNSYIGHQGLMLFQQSQSVSESESKGGDGSLKDEIKNTEKDVILAALDRNRWQRQKTAQELGINRVTLYNKMKKYGLSQYID
jgi:transcriptional regulator with PAS, ATPase and Fis domain